MVAADRRAGLGPEAPAFLVFDEGGWQAEVPDGGASGWAEFPHAESRQRGFVMVPGARILSPAFEVDADHCLHAEVIRATDPVSADGLDLEIALITSAGRVPLLVHHLGNSVCRNVPHVVRAELRAFEGLQARLEVICGPGPEGDAAADWAGVISLAIATVDKLSLASARSQYGWRLQNEAGHFTDAYAAPLYSQGPPPSSDRSAGAESIANPVAPPVDLMHSAEAYRQGLVELVPHDGESAYGYAARLLAHLTPQPHIDFAARLAQIGQKGRPFRLLSLCAGAARVEEMLLRGAGVPVELTLIDLNDHLLRQAAARMPAGTVVIRARGRAEDLSAVARGHYDAVCFVSGLHHVVDLEHVLRQVRSVLAEDGELWLIGEQLGRNGNRMWPDARHVAERVFAALPERLRLNRNTARVDERLPDLDFGTSGFEGVRSEDLEQAVARFFVPVRHTLRNCFMWRITDLAYIENFDLKRQDDVEEIRRIVAEEFAFYANGGIGCELNGVYRDKLRS